MFILQNNNDSTTSHHRRLYTPKGAGKGVATKPPVLILQVGSDLDPGIRRKNRPNEDTLFITRGVMPSTSTSTSPKPFAFLMVADGIGGHEHGQEASRLAVQSLVKFVSSSLYSKQMSPADFLPLLREGIISANRAVYQHNQ